MRSRISSAIPRSTLRGIAGFLLAVLSVVGLATAADAHSRGWVIGDDGSEPSGVDIR